LNSRVRNSSKRGYWNRRLICLSSEEDKTKERGVEEEFWYNEDKIKVGSRKLLDRNVGG